MCSLEHPHSWRNSSFGLTKSKGIWRPVPNTLQENIAVADAFVLSCWGLFCTHKEWCCFPLWIITEASLRLCKNGLGEISIFSCERWNQLQRKAENKAFSCSRGHIWWPDANIIHFWKCLISQVALCSVSFTQHIWYFILMYTISTEEESVMKKKLYKARKLSLSVWGAKAEGTSTPWCLKSSPLCSQRSTVESNTWRMNVATTYQ